MRSNDGRAGRDVRGDFERHDAGSPAWAFDDSMARQAALGHELFHLAASQHRGAVTVGDAVRHSHRAGERLHEPAYGYGEHHGRNQQFDQRESALRPCSLDDLYVRHPGYRVDAHDTAGAFRAGDFDAEARDCAAGIQDDAALLVVYSEKGVG
jgi:hypothetical protein